MTIQRVAPPEMDGGARPKRTAGVWSWLAAASLVLAVGVLTKAPELILPIGPDQGTYSYVAERILRGELPYVDAWDNKPPLTYYAHAAVLALLPEGTRWSRSCLPWIAQPCGYMALQVADVVWTLATALALFALARRLLASTGSALAAVALFALFASLSQLSHEGNTPEKQLLLPMVLAYLAVLYTHQGGGRWWAVVAGAMVSVAFLFKQTALSIPAALVLWWAWERCRTRGARGVASGALPGLALFLAGFAIPLTLVMGYLSARGALGAFWDASFGYNLSQAGGNLLAVPRGFAAGSWQVFSGSSAVLWLLALGGALWIKEGRGPSGLRLAVCWAAADVLSLFLGGSKFAQVYYVQLVPSFAVLAAVGLSAAWQLARQSFLQRAYLLVGLLAIFALSSSVQAGVLLRVWNERIPPRTSVPPEQQGRARFAALAERGPLFVWGDASQVYVLTEGRSPSRFFHVYPLSPFYARGEQYLARRRELLADMEQNPPVAILIDPAMNRDDPDGKLGLNVSTFPELEQLIATHYVGMNPNILGGGWQAYMRR